MRLGVLLPDFAVADIVQRATELYGEAPDWEPEEAAEAYAYELPPVDPGEPEMDVPRAADTLGSSNRAALGAVARS